MEHYVGLDVSLKQTSICVVNQEGSVLREGVVESDPDAIGAFVRSNAPGVVRVGLETGPTATWLWTELKRLGLPVICIDARHAQAVLKMQINKSDRNDSRDRPHHANRLVQGGARQGYRQPLGQGATGEPGVAGQDQA
jgi:transposase